MCEIPNNVISLDAFAEFSDGFSIGSNDLTQLALGADRDSELVAFDYSEGELNPDAVVWTTLAVAELEAELTT